MLDSEILADFKVEAKGLLGELEEVVEKLEEASTAFPGGPLSEFAQKIDRIMGAAQTLNQMEPGHMGLKRIGNIAQICKSLGYKAAEIKIASLVPLFAAFWADTLEVLDELVEAVEDEAKSSALAGSFSSVLQNRLNWLGEKIQKMAPNATGTLPSQAEIDKLLAGK